MAVAEHRVSRRALLGAAFALPLARHPGLDPGSIFLPSAAAIPGWIPDPPDLIRGPDDEKGEQRANPAVPIWDRALARFHTAQAAVDAAAHEPDQDRYDTLGNTATDALCAFLALPAPDLAAIAAKLDVIVPHLAWELTGAEDCLESLRRDARRLAATAA